MFFENRTRRVIAPFLALLLLLSACTAGGGGGGGGSSGTASSMRLMRAEGSVQVEKDEISVSVRERMILYDGYGVGTGGESYAWISLDDTKLAKLDQESGVTIRKSRKTLELYVSSGSVYFNVTEPLADDETLNIRTATIVVGIRGTSGWVTVEGDSLSVAILNGAVEVQILTDGEPVTETVRAGETATLSLVDGEPVIDVYEFYEADVPAFVRTADDERADGAWGAAGNDGSGGRDDDPGGGGGSSGGAGTGVRADSPLAKNTIAVNSALIFWINEDGVPCLRSRTGLFDDIEATAYRGAASVYLGGSKYYSYMGGAVLMQDGRLYIFDDLETELSEQADPVLTGVKAFSLYRAQAEYSPSYGAVTGDGVFVWGDVWPGDGREVTVFLASPQKVERLQFEAVDIAVTPDCCLVVTSGGDSGHFWGWGRNIRCQLGLSEDDVSLSTPMAILGISMSDCLQVDCFDNHCAVLFSSPNRSNRLYVWGDNRFGQCGQPLDSEAVEGFPVVLEDVKSVSCGPIHTSAITTDGTLYSWGHTPLAYNAAMTAVDAREYAAGNTEVLGVLTEPLLIASNVAAVSWDCFLTADGVLHMMTYNGPLDVASGVLLPWE